MPVQTTFETVCNQSGGVILEGFLHLSSEASCEVTDSLTLCRIYLLDPLSEKSISILMPIAREAIAEQKGYPHATFLWLSDDLVLGEKDMLQITGPVQPTNTTGDLQVGCEISMIYALKELDSFTSIDWDMPKATLRDAIKKNWVDAIVVGDGLTQIKVKIKPKIDFHLNIEIEQGTIFETQSSGVQNMVVRKASYIHVKPSGEADVDVDVSCADMEKRQPSNYDSFTVSKVLGSEDLMKLLRSRDFLNEPLRIQQFAVWTITDNPAPDEYVSISSGIAVFEGPSRDELTSVKNLFLQAGIDISKYQALAQ